MILAKVEKALLFLAILFLPLGLGSQVFPQFSYVFALPVKYLSPTIYLWDLLVLCLLSISLLQKRAISKGALNLVLIFILSQAFSLIPLLQNDQRFSISQGVVRLEQYLIAGLFGVYIASQRIYPFLTKKSLLMLSLAVFIFGASLYINHLDQVGIRKELTQASLVLFHSSPTLGIGLNNFIPIAAAKQLALTIQPFQPPSNIFLLTLVETGILGLIGLIGLLGYPVIKILNALRNNLSLLILIPLWCSIVFIGFRDYFLLVEAEGLRLLFLIWGLSLAAVSSKILK